MKKKELKKRRFLSCINGTKGAISLVMAVLMTPFLTIAVMLVEAGRYNSAVSVLDEAMGVTSLSTLADYDDYLHDRWGLLALDQGVDLSTTYADQIDINSKAMGSSIEIENATASGDHALAELKILEAQLMEYCKLNAPTKLGKEVMSKLASMLELIDIIKKIKEGVDFAGNISSLLSKGVSTMDAGISMAKSVEILEETAKTLDGLKDDYANNYSTFASTMNTLIDNLKKKDEKQKELDPLEDDLKILKEELQALEDEEPSTDSEKKANKEAIKAKEKEIEEKEEEMKPIQKEIDSLKSTISKNRDSANTAKNNYAGTINSIKENLETFKANMANCEAAVEQVQQNIAGAVSDGLTIAKDIEQYRTKLDEKAKSYKENKDKLDAMEKNGVAKDDPAYIAQQKTTTDQEKEVSELQTQLGEMETAKAMSDATSEGLGELHNKWNEASGGYSDAVIGQIIGGFEKLHGKVSGVNTYNVTAKTAKVTTAEYKNVSVAGYIDASEIQNYIDAQEKELKEGSLKALMDGLMGIYNTLMSLSIFFEEKLDSRINVQHYQDTIGGLPGGTNADNPILSVMQNIGNICKSGGSFLGNLKESDFVGILTDLKSILENTISLFKNIAKVVENFITNIVEIFKYEKWYTTIYSTYNLPCRTDFSAASNSVSFKTMTGYGVPKEAFDKPSERPNVPVFGELSALIDEIVKGFTGTNEDLMFTGAELEYVLFGSTSEVSNQLYVFTAIYLIRMISSLPAITADAEVQSLAASATLGYPVVIALYILLEPLVQTVLMVNGSPQELIPTEVYLSPTGLPKLVNEMIWFCHLNTTQSEQLSDKMVEAVSKSRDDYDYQSKLYEYKTQNDPSKGVKGISLKVSYREYCMVLLLLTVTKDQQLARISNLIQMEAHCYYTSKKKDYTFDLKNSYTFIKATVDAKINQLLPSLIEDSMFTVQRENYRGY